MGPKCALFRLCSLLLAVGLSATFRSGGEAADPTPRAPDQQTPEGREAVASALERLRQTGCFNHPDYPWVVRARLVRGDTLSFVGFLLRREDGKGFNRVGKAVQATLSYSEEYRPFTFPGDDPLPPVRRDTLRVRVCQMQMHSEEMDFECDERTIDLALPGRLRESGFRPFAEAEARLSQDQQKALGKDFSLRPEQRLLVAAFGEGCYDLLRSEVGHGETGQTVVAYERCGEGSEDGWLKFPTIAVARFDKTGEVLTSFRGKDITAKADDDMSLTSGDDSHDLTLKGPGGLKFVLPGTKAAP
jgi:hypothetical protein